MREVWDAINDRWVWVDESYLPILSPNQKGENHAKDIHNECACGGSSAAVRLSTSDLEYS